MLKRLFGSGGAKAEEKMDPREQTREWNRKLKAEIRSLDRQITGIEREKLKVVNEIKQAAKKNEVSAVKILAKEVVRSQKQIERFHETKAQINSVSMQLQHMAATMRVSQTISRSTEVMKGMSKVINAAGVTDAMRDMSREMERMGLIDSMISDAMDTMDGAEIEEETEQQVAQVLYEHAADVIAQLPEASRKQLPQLAPATKQPVEKQKNDDEIMARLAGL